MKYFTILAIVLVATSNAKSDLCVPESVKDISLDSNFLLTWKTISSTCTIAKFLVDITDVAHKILYTYPTNQSGLLLSSLRSCQNYTINIRPISDDNLAGPTAEKHLFTSISKDADLRILLSTTTVTSETLTFKWDLEDNSLVNCVSSYEVTYFNEESDPLIINQTGTNFTIRHPLPCMNYTFQVKAVVLDSQASTPIAIETVRTTATDPPSVPELLSKEPNTTTADFFFTVPLYKEYQCEFSLFILIVGVNYKQQYQILVEGDTHRTNPVTIHVDNLKPNNVYDCYAWGQNEAGKSDNVTFLLQTHDTTLES